MLNRMYVLGVASLGLAGLSACTHTEHHASKEGCCVRMHDDDDKGEKKEKEGKDEQKVAVDQLPAAVVATVMKECPDGKITDAEKEMRKGKTVYELDVKSGETVYEIKTAEDGKFVSKKVDDEKDEKEEK